MSIVVCACSCRQTEFPLGILYNTTCICIYKRGGVLGEIFHSLLGALRLLSRKMEMFAHSLFLVICLLVCRESHGKSVCQMTPGGKNRIIEVHSTLTLTCICAYQRDFKYDHLSFRWQLPDFLVKNPQVNFCFQIKNEFLQFIYLRNNIRDNS
jgi:hypothetical protein